MDDEKNAQVRSAELLHMILAQQLAPLAMKLAKTTERPIDYEHLEKAVWIANMEGQWVADAIRNIAIDFASATAPESEETSPKVTS